MYKSVISRKPTRLICLAVGLMAWLSLAAAADLSGNMWGLCPATPQAPPLLGGSSLPADRFLTYLYADYGEGKLDELYSVRGHVLIRRGIQQMEADQAVYDDRTGMVNATGNIRLQQDGMLSQGTQAHFNLNDETGEMANANYQFLEQHAHGTADTIIRLSPDITHLHRATYTTCDPGKVDWELHARDITIDQAKEVGEAYNVTLRIKDIPLIYFPYINFPLSDERKSGILAPTLGYSSHSGFYAGVPYYWNIAPNYDTTIIPIWLENRGLQAKDEFRYLTKSSEGEIHAELLPDDTLYGGPRGTFAYRDTTRLSSHWQANINAQYVSDDAYFSDLGGSLITSSTTQVERRVDLNYNDQYTSFLARAQGFQTLDPTLPAAALPYQVLPQLLFAATTPAQDSKLTYRIDGEYVYFDRADSVTGSRLNLTPSVAWPLESESYFLIPKIAMNYTRYQLNGQPAGTAPDPTRATPLLSLDSGVFLERDTTIGTHSFLNTLEPRLYYLEVPYRDQANLPLFNTYLYDFSFSQLFRDNRFSGADRLADANQLSAAVTSRLISQDTGREWLSGSIGEIFYFANRLVTLGTPVETQQTSSIVTEASTHISEQWFTRVSLIYNPDTNEEDQGAIQYQYHLGKRGLFNASYLYLRAEPTQLPLRQTDFSFLWQLNPRWQLLGRWNYSELDNRPVETLFGVQYDACCWRVRAVTRYYVSDVFGRTNNATFLEWELKGLGSSDRSLETILKTDILGYQPGF